MKFRDALKQYRINYIFFDGRLNLIGGNADAREYFQKLLEKKQNEAEAIIDLMQVDQDIADYVLERAAIMGGSPTKLVLDPQVNF